MYFLKEYIEDVYRLFYPKTCGACEQHLVKGEEHLCLICSNNLPQTKFETLQYNPAEQIFDGRADIEFVTAFLYFAKGELTQKILHNIKYNQKKQLAVFLGKRMGEMLSGVHKRLTFDAVMPVPLHPKKLKMRGYNQSLLIAEGIAEVLSLPIYSNVLLRAQHTDTQTRKNRMERWENISNAFEMKHSEKIKDKHILLIDDVLTTGATLEACAHTIKSKENTKISIATLAMALS
jgi:ComF family protein